MIGRHSEIDELRRWYESSESEFVAIYGRRRVGKTYLVREVFEGSFTFHHTGHAVGGLRQQLRYFHHSLEEYGYSGSVCPGDWPEAFLLLRRLVESSHQKRKVIFFDEMPWLDTARSGFLPALEAFWNGWASARKDILLIVCGSAASWMVKNLICNKGGLHNRLTGRICLQPFTLGECEEYAREMGLAFTRQDVAECYMALGGIPYYWRLLDHRYSVAQNFDRLFFAEGAPLRNEFSELYASLFGKSSGYERVVTQLAKKRIGMSQSELSEALNIHSSGVLTEMLNTLETSGFIRRYRSFGKSTRDAIYQLMDEFTLFHFRFLGKDGPSDPVFWTTTLGSASQETWRGLAFERLCLQHLPQLRKALGIQGIHVEAYSWLHRADETVPEGCQIDMLLERSDNVINLCEMKYYGQPLALNAGMLAELERKAEIFRQATGTRKAIHLTVVSANGVVHNAYRNRIQASIDLDMLFE